VIRALGSGLIDVAYVAHPSFVDKAELEKINGPLSISAAGKVTLWAFEISKVQNGEETNALAETDKIFTSEKRHETEAILKEIGQPYQINLFSNVEHGFAVRGDVSIKAKKFAKEQAFYQVLRVYPVHGGGADRNFRPFSGLTSG
jgi:dienelactone hydrolase